LSCSFLNLQVHVWLPLLVEVRPEFANHTIEVALFPDRLSLGDETPQADGLGALLAQDCFQQSGQVLALL
jgi:hypothetical protein